ncbi:MULTISPECIES: hypothetical protein [Bacillus subtilis group]|uniref:hypothetical protein n=1 Tax=Bacillus subtilis group TaxID=653685 RepID=UPI001C2206CD|nr:MULTISPECIES: hypothetical protein [Bacillus subtilis group]MBU8803393.1 hypothetical protein [Bacillus subtilis]MCY9015101.1 hypothetical protein [Bacillus inaquosorum]
MNFSFSSYPYYNMIKHIVNMKRFSLWFTHITFIGLFLMFQLIKDYFSSEAQTLINTTFIVTGVIVILVWIIYFVFFKLRNKSH